MDQDATQWKTLFKRANQLLRATTHPAVVQLPVEGSLPSLTGATQWLNSPPLTTADLRANGASAAVATSPASSPGETRGALP